MAIAGLALSGVWLLAICVGVVVAILASGGDVKATIDPTVKPSKETSVKVETLKTGDCVNDLKETDKCFDILDAYSPSTRDDESIGLYYVHPTRSSWSQGDRQVLCIAEHTEGRKTGSIKG